MAWEGLVLSGALTGCPDVKERRQVVADALNPVHDLAPAPTEPEPAGSTTFLSGGLVAAPRRNRTRGIRKAV